MDGKQFTLRIASTGIVLALAGALATPAHALTFNYTFGSSITGLSDSSTVESTIAQTMDEFQSLYSNPVTVNIDFENVSYGLGTSVTGNYDVPYTDYVEALGTDKGLAPDTGLLQYIQPEANGGNPVNDNADISVTSADARAIGLPAIEGYSMPGVSGPSGTDDSQINLNLSLIDPSEGTPSADLYSLASVVSHETDEVLGIGSALDANNAGSSSLTGSALQTVLNGSISDSDLWRYASDGVRSFNIDPTTNAYFSIDGGKTDLQQFNQQQGADYNDWAGTWNGGVPYVQDAYGSPGTNPQFIPGGPEEQEEQVLGWNLNAVAPEQSSLAAFALPLALGALVLGLKKKNSVSQEG